MFSFFCIGFFFCCCWISFYFIRDKNQEMVMQQVNVFSLISKEEKITSDRVKFRKHLNSMSLSSHVYHQITLIRCVSILSQVRFGGSHNVTFLKLNSSFKPAICSIQTSPSTQHTRPNQQIQNTKKVKWYIIQ